VKDGVQPRPQVVICVADNCGRLIGKWRAAHHLEEVLAEGLAMPNFHLVTGLENVPHVSLQVTGPHRGFPNGRLLPDPDTRFRVPGHEGIDHYLADAYHADKTLVEEAPRSILKRQIARLEDSGLGATMASELEFYLFLQSFAELAEQDYRLLRPYHHRHGDNDLFVSGLARAFVRQLIADLAGAGIEVDQFQGEGGAGQLELNMAPSLPLKACDQHAVFKHVVKLRAALEGNAVTFMARPFEEGAGSGGHIHLCLTDREGHCLLTDGEKPKGQAAAFLAGVLAYTGDFAVLHAPYGNSYRRLRRGAFTPLNASWGWDNRSCLVRVTGCGPNARLEFRLPGADANPYLAYAALLASGLAGLEERLELGAPVASDATSADRPHLPRDLTEAVQSFEHSAVARRALGAGVHRHLLQLAREELEIERTHVTDWDRRRCFEAV